MEACLRLAAILLLLLAIDAPGAEPAPSSPGQEAPCAAAQALISRLIPDHANRFVCRSIPAVEGRDAYEIETRNGTILLRGSSGVAIASALYHYLKEYCHCHASWNGDQLALPVTLPAVPGTIRIVATVQDRFAYNYCTHGYTMPFWDWSAWERELDWLALHGMNMALIIQGQEAVWQNTFARFNYTREEIRQWLCSPVHLPWQFMQNMEGVMPPSQALIDKRVALGRRIVQRCHELGIRPVLQGFFGMVPTGFVKKFPDAVVVPQGGWAGGNRRPDMLHIKDPRFVPIATAFLEEQARLFGSCHHFAADPFHEGGRPGDMKRGAVFKVIQDAISAFDPQAVTVKQCWQTSNKEMFDAGDRSRILALDLWCDAHPFWNRCNGYDGTPWIWCMLQNFGGNVGMEGNPAKLVADFGKVLASPGRGRLTGIAIVPEGSHQNPLIYELMTEMAWRGAPADLDAWMADYVHARYGRVSAPAMEAWRIMLRTNYAAPSGETPVNSIIPAVPRFDANIKARTWCPGTRAPYDNAVLATAWSGLLAAAPACGATDTFRFDVADVARQVLCNLSRAMYDRMSEAWKARDPAAFTLHSRRLLNLIRDLDTLAATRADWLMGRWVADARAWGDTAEDQAYLDHCARIILTTWVTDPHTNLSDYANREWHGLLGQYYLKRWEMFIEAVGADLAGTTRFDQKVFDQARGRFEVAWITGRSPLPATPQGDTIAVAKGLFDQYAPLLQAYAGVAK